MTRQLHAPLRPEEEIFLRRIAHGSTEIDKRIAERLVVQALVERAATAFRLTPLGLLRFKALPKAPLLAPRRSLQAIAGYVSSVIDRAQVRVGAQGNQGPDATRSPGLSFPTERQPEDQDGEGQQQVGEQGRQHGK